MRNVTPLLLTGLTSLCLLACASSPERDARQESDLAVMVMGIKALLPPRDPAGALRAEDVTTTGDAWNLLLDLEDVDYLHEQDKLRAIEFVTSAARHIEQSRRPCTGWDRFWNLRECR